jgi:hypothetical protein
VILRNAECRIQNADGTANERLDPRPPCHLRNRGFDVQARFALDRSVPPDENFVLARFCIPHSAF